MIQTVIEPNAPNGGGTEVPTEYAMLRTSQLTLGTTSIFFGFFVHEWSTLQDRYLRFRGLPHERNQAQSAVRGVTAALLLQVHHIWLIRNTHLHQTDPMQQYSYTHIHLLAQIKELYDCIPLMLAADRDIMSIPYSARLEQPTSTLQTFYKWAKPLVDKSVQDANELGRSFQRIDHYFCP